MYMPVKLMNAIKNKDNESIQLYKTKYLQANTLTDWYRLFDRCVSAIDTGTYKFTDFTPQVISKNADKPNVSEIKHTGHNED